MKNQRLAYLFKKHIEKSCTEQERAELAFLLGSAENTEDLKSLIDGEWGNFNEIVVMDQARSESIFEKIISRQEDKKRPAGLARRSFWWVAAAAVALFLIRIIPNDAYVTSPAVSLPLSETIVSGENSRFVVLPDGSKVTLNRETSLTFNTGLSGNTREVILQGEAYFDIAHDTLRPFLVRADAIDITVLGTAFNVKAYESDKNIIVTVNRGKVRVSRERDALATLLPDQQITFDKTKASAHAQQTDAQAAIGWQRKYFIFDDVRMSDAAMELEARFGKKLVFTDENIAHCHFSGTFLREESLEQILQVLCAFNNAHYTIREDIIFIKGEGCQATN